MNKNLTYESIPKLSKKEIEDAISHGDPNVLVNAILSAALRSGDAEYAENICIQCSDNYHYHVRGIAILGFGHIARIHGMLNEAKVKPIIAGALKDESEYVRAEAIDTMEGTRLYLGWRY